MTAEAIRVGVLGYGLAGSAFHAPLVATTPGLVLTAVVTANADRAAAVHERYPGVRVWSSAEELLASGEVDLVVVATPNDTHVPLARRALTAGCDVVVDKPVAASAAEALTLQELADERGRMISVYQNRRWDTDYLTLTALIGEGRLGEVRRFESRFEGWSPRATGGWRESGDPALAGGLLYDLGAHLIDQAVQLFGPVAAVYAEADTRREGVGAVDDVFVALTHRGGVRSHLWMSKVAGHAGPRLRVLGSEAAFVAYGLDPQENALRAGGTPAGSGGWGVHPDGRSAALWRGAEEEAVPLVPGDYRAFYAGIERAIRHRETPPVLVHEAAYVLEVIAAARLSAAEGVVTIPGEA